jgi:Na+-driven multidrug efflux pump
MVMTSIVRANGAVVVPFAILVISVIVVRMLVGFGLYPSFGSDAIWWAFMGSSTASAILAVAYYFHGGWRKSKRAGAGMITVPAE